MSPRSHPTAPERPPPGPTPAVAVLWTVAAALALVVLEWVFHATKPSMFSVMGWGERIALLLSALAPAASLAAAGALLAAVAAALWRRVGGGGEVALRLLLLPASLVVAAIALLMVENFTRTVFGFNVGSFRSPLRYLYAAGLVGAVVLCNHRLRRAAAHGAPPGRRAAAVALACALAAAAVAAALRSAPQGGPLVTAVQSARPLPNILLFSSDGIEARRMSVYGSSRPTTPFLASRSDEFLVSENHLTNSALTAGSTGALLTGKLPTTTGVTQQLDVFTARDVYEHLPGVLRQLGYHGIEIGARHTADSSSQNLRHGFHVSNFRRMTGESFGWMRWYSRRFPAESHFLGSVAERVRERVAHAFGLEQMHDSTLDPAIQQPEWESDTTRMAALFRELDRAPRPFFAHVHLLDTHGPYFRFGEQRFSSGDQVEKWDLDFLDDAILTYDRYVKEVVGYLEGREELDRTVLVINSDHGVQWGTTERLPLLIRFPGGEHSGRIAPNTQRIDIAPTLLAYLGLPPPEWMEGQPLIGTELDPLRTIYASTWPRSASYMTLTLLQCQRWLRLEPDSGRILQGSIDGHTAPCPTERLLSAAEARRRMVGRLAASRHFVAPLELGRQLHELLAERNPEQRRELARAIRDGLTETWQLDRGMLLARAYSDFWTYGTSAAGLLVVNEGDEPVRRELVVRSGIEREFPFRFHIDDGDATHDYRFDASGAMPVELPPVPPRSERLFIVWSDRAAVRKWGRQVGVLLQPSLADRLRRLVREGDGRERAALAGSIVAGATESRRLAETVWAAGLTWDLWTTGVRPAAVVVENRGDAPLQPRLTVDGGPGRTLPLAVYVEDGDRVTEHSIREPGGTELELAAVPPGESRLFVVWSEESWRSGRRELGVRLRRPGGEAPTATAARGRVG